MFRKDITRIAFKVTTIYVLVGGAWIFFSDEVLALLARDKEAFAHLSIAKGWLFTLITAIMLFLLINRAVTAIHQSRDYYLKILEDFPALIWRAGTDAKCDYFNKTWLSFTGRTHEQEIGDGWAEGVHPEDLDNCLKTYLEAFNSRQTFAMEYRLRRHDGEYRWIVDHGKPIYDLFYKFAGYIGSCYDITERKQAEEALFQSEQRFRELTENTSDWVWEVDTTMRYVYSSPKVTDLLGYAPADVLGKTPFDLMPPEEAARLQPALAEVLKNPQPFKSLENVNMRRNGSLVVLETSGVPVYGPDGRFTGFRGIDRDISERKEAEEKILALNAELTRQATALEAANSELEAFGYTVAHDLRKPLTSISLGCQVIMDICGKHIREECKRIILDMCSTTEKMDQLITSLLKFSRVSRSELHMGTVDLSAMARVIIAELRLNNPERRVSIAIAEGATARGDADLLRAVMENLIGNAWKYTRNRETTVIEFGILESSGERVYFIRDNGIGFDMSQADKLFDAFQRLPGTNEYEGHGIGLATVKRIVQRHGGRVWAEGEAGTGSTFYFTLPPEQQATLP
jgi:PAS domain S-box-containing protein